MSPLLVFLPLLLWLTNGRLRLLELGDRSVDPAGEPRRRLETFEASTHGRAGGRDAVLV